MPGTRPSIRTTGPDDLAALEALYPACFPEEDLLPLVRALLDLDAGVTSLAAIAGGSLAGHAIFTAGHVAETGQQVALLGPLAVSPGHQRRGIGRALVDHGIGAAGAAGAAAVLVLGDSGYYGRLGFIPRAGMAPPCPIPDAWRDAWQVRATGHAEPPTGGTLVLPGPWNDPALWSG